ncbi:hypothetical protein JCM17845_28230 [Iodidimonas gelatinilytica]|uniref:Alpha-glutamyl/putrescinyl thymine pyrophosphorylase clade 3 domain-containing protein n=1 Tax=Iodidimonas gelatinilytica TaxID=1236966 RepID=A0A5A7N4B2_9PROT|nr:hypothetical protein [Iodidimonas gelatinilytica]GER02200.1 hypothetical protein JCM17845_28230 [Iodidimonas gelatinilytica]
MRIKDQAKSNQISTQLDDFSASQIPLVGMNSPNRKPTLIAQIVDSIRRIEYLLQISIRSSSASLYTPYSGSFQPLAGATALHRAGQIDDAYWLVYLATHFGKHKHDGWNLIEDIYGRFGQGGVWDWHAVSQNPQAIANWLKANYPHVTSVGRSRRFGNHRKYETLKPGPKGTGHAVATYIKWINAHGSHAALIQSAQASVGQNPQEVFAFLYRELDNVAKFGRLGKFDFLCNLSNLQISPIYPDKAYIKEATGPQSGARMLFGDTLTVSQLENACIELAAHLNVSGQVIEDSLCNWQKSPEQYIYFRG